MSKYRSDIYIYTRYLGHVEHDKYEFNQKSFKLEFYDANDHLIGQVGDLGGLVRVKTYETDNPGTCVATHHIKRQIAFKNKGPYVVTYNARRLKELEASN